MPRPIALICAGLGLLLALELRGEIVVHADHVLHEASPLVGGTNIRAHTPLLQASERKRRDLARAGIRLVRMVTFPDPHAPAHDLAYFDRDVAAVLAAGATPLFVQYINPGLPYRTADGAAGGDIASNLVCLVRRYRQAPFNLRDQIWEIGNEPDFTVDHRVGSPEEYTGVFLACDRALRDAGLRDHVRLAGPVVMSPYRWVGRDWSNTRLIDHLLDHAAKEVDVVTYHHYAPGPDKLPTPAALLNDPSFDALEDPSRPAALPLDNNAFGMPALLARLEALDPRRRIRVGITEYNAAGRERSLEAGLYNVALTRFHLLNPRSLLTCSYVFDADPSSDGHGHYNPDGTPDFNHDALFIRNRLAGRTLLRHEAHVPPNAHGHPSLLVLATRSDEALFLEVLNRSTEASEQELRFHGLAADAFGEVHELSERHRPAAPVGRWRVGDRRYVFPPLSVTVLRFAR